MMMRVSQATILMVFMGALALPAGAQRAPTAPTASATASPTPEAAPQACAECEQLDKLRAKLESQRRELDRSYDAARDKFDMMTEKGDSASRADYEDAARKYAYAKRQYSETSMRLMSMEASRMAREATTYSFKFNESRPKAPAGWLGINFIASYNVVTDSGRRRMIFSEYPVIEGVEPGSPAEKAGVESRDVLIALGGRDLLKGTLTFNELLQPGTKVTLKLKRGRATIDRVAMIERRPSSWGRMEMPTPMPEMAPDAPMPPDGPMIMSAPGMPRVMVAPRAPGDPEVRVDVWYDNLTIAGAHVQQFNASALKDYFGVDSGLLVLSVLPGTPAARAGLKDGDVIVRASGRSVTTPAQFSRMIERARDGAISLDIVRQRKKQTLEMTW
jgi:C-terminal processing protease CtpA/Prc